MKRMSVALAIYAVLGTSAACAGTQGGETSVPVYDATQVAHDRYTIIRRIGIDGWQSAFRVRAHENMDSARTAVITEAARMGADGVVNLTCFDQTERVFRRSGYFCYGNAIRVKNERKVVK